MMQPLHGGAAARPFVTHHNTLDIDLYLRIAPELYLKRLVVGGLERVYEINRNFRNEGISTRHNPEFTMLEFYQAYTDYQGMMELSKELLRAARDRRDRFDSGQSIDGHDASTSRNFASSPCARLSSSSGRTRTSRLSTTSSDPEWLHAHSQESSPGAALVDIFERHAEGQLIQPTFIYDFPVEVSPLSKNKPDEPDFVERFEIYAAAWRSRNAFTELNDPQEQRRRFEHAAWRAKRAATKKRM